MSAGPRDLDPAEKSADGNGTLALALAAEQIMSTCWKILDGQAKNE